MPHKKNHEQLLQVLNIKPEDLSYVGSVLKVYLENGAWQKAATSAAKLNYRLSALFASEKEEYFELNVILELQASYLLLRTAVMKSCPEISSFTPSFPAANRLERHVHDMFGIDFINHPDKRRWTRHHAWGDNEFPLRKNFTWSSQPPLLTPPDNDYPFLQVNGTGICEIPVGPVHAGIIEPGHFRFKIAGEDIISMEERLAYTHKGIEKLAEGREVNDLVKIAGRVSGDSTVSHAWATCKALESAADLEVPERALYLRAIMCERERIANHLGDFAAICNDVAYSFAYYQLMYLKELWLRLNKDVFKHRLMMDCVIPGGVTFDLDNQKRQEIQNQIAAFNQELNELLVIFEESSSLHDRIKTTGKLSIEKAKLCGALGYVGRASGQKFDLRQDLGYPPYNKLQIRVPNYSTGDVLARLRIRYQEILVSLDLISQLLDTLPKGPIFKPWHNHNKALEGIGMIEGWRGEIITFVSLDQNNLVERFFPRDPSWFNWLALEQLLDGNIVPDFPVCNKSINGSYSGVDL
jgi:Ni,Fe-hydrogenase III large subunit/Ni,Fe-hydrogenase III component G